MKKSFFNKLVLTSVLAVICFGATDLVMSQAVSSTSTPSSTIKHERHPAIHAAISALEKARIDLKDAAHDFGGHRESALKAVDNALAELRDALKYDKK